MIEVVQYETADGRCPFAEWFEDLDRSAALKVATALARLETGNFADTKPVGEGVLERRIDWGPGYRVYFGRYGIGWWFFSREGRRSARRLISVARRCIGPTIESEARSAEEMALTRSFRETVKKRASRDPEFRVGLLREAVEALLRDELDVGKVLLRDYINATVGFETLGEATRKSPKSLMRMLSADGNPRADNLFSVIAHLQQREGIELGVQTRR